MNNAWPKRIFYVCNSTFGSVVNAIPIAHAGASRIVGAKVLCEADNPSKPTQVEKRQSIDPADRLIKFACELGIKSVERQTLQNSHSYLGWSNVLTEISEIAKQMNATLVYNVTGGKKNMCLGLPCLHKSA